jgi:hypothetical protein
MPPEPRHDALAATAALETSPDEDLDYSCLLDSEQLIPQRLKPLRRLADLLLFAKEMFKSLHGHAKHVPVAFAKRRLRVPQGLPRPGQLIALSHLRLGYPPVTSTKHDRQGLLKRWFHGQSVAVAHDDALQLGDVRAFRDQVHRLNIQKGLLDRDYEQIASDHARAALVP